MNQMSNFSYSSSKAFPDKAAETSLIPIVDIICLIVRGCITKGIREMKEYAPTSIFQNFEDCPSLPAIVESYFVNQAFYTRYFLPWQHINDSILQITGHLCWGDKENSKFFINELNTLLCQGIGFNQVYLIVKVLGEIMKLQDVHQNTRIDVSNSNYKKH
jgi:hypothetical protein